MKLAFSEHHSHSVKLHGMDHFTMKMCRGMYLEHAR